MAAVPPSYGDLGKSARDLFGKGFNFGFYKLECKTKTKSGVEFTTSGSNNHESGKVNGSLETKYKWSDYGITFNEKWTTDNTLGTEISIEDQFAKGLKLSFDTKFTPLTGKKAGCVKTSYKQDHINISTDVNLEYAGPVVNAAAVLGYTGWMAGYQMSFDTSKSALTKSNFAAGYTAGDFTVHANVNDGKEFAGSYHQKVNTDLETGVQLSHTTGSATRFGLAAKYTPEKDTTIRAKINNSCQIGLSYQQKIRSGVSLTLSTMIEGKNINEGGHKVGLDLDLAA
jgi:voltage-dependent anion channel protein 2